MNMMKQKLIIALPLLVIAVIFVFSLAMIPSINPAPTNLPIAIINEDQGVDLPNQQGTNLGEAIIKNIQNSQLSQSGEKPAVKWIKVNKWDEGTTGLNNQEYYGALVIPPDFSKQQASLQTANPTSPQIKIYINQGMNTSGSAMAGQILNQIIDGINTKIRTELLAAFDQQGGKVTTKQASILAAPIAREVINVNETGTHSANGNAPVSMFQPIWMGSLIGGVIFYLSGRKLTFAGRLGVFGARVSQICIGAVMALLAGFGLAWFAKSWGLHITSFTDTALFLALCYMAFFLMISAVFSWIGLKGMAIFVLMLFFGAPLLAIPPELLSSFYQDLVFSWLPMRFMVDGLREIFFFQHGFSLNHATLVLIGIGSTSLVLLLASALKYPAKQDNPLEVRSKQLA